MEYLDRVRFFEKFLQPVKVGRRQGVANGLHQQCTCVENLLTIPMWDPPLSEFVVNVSDQVARFLEVGYHLFLSGTQQRLMIGKLTGQAVKTGNDRVRMRDNPSRYRRRDVDGSRVGSEKLPAAVSYTHLTLPTN